MNKAISKIDTNVHEDKLFLTVIHSVNKIINFSKIINISIKKVLYMYCRYIKCQYIQSFDIYLKKHNILQYIDIFIYKLYINWFQYMKMHYLIYKLYFLLFSNIYFAIYFGFVRVL